ncbi:hypothetical protein JTE90_000203 [Oedothorax gibbosus]|uniref:Uncharacterized protein n=1 Tax=Oedothorax gibbosus TaxID=931172 RepID=A0AAV6VD18_9ARAC|nr:hypothetical protein JTE90_000203 [Oedothorax gibbosus]
MMLSTNVVCGATCPLRTGMVPSEGVQHSPASRGPGSRVLPRSDSHRGSGKRPTDRGWYAPRTSAAPSRGGDWRISVSWPNSVPSPQASTSRKKGDESSKDKDDKNKNGQTSRKIKKPVPPKN